MMADEEGARLHTSLGLESTSRTERWPALDAARGVAIAAMVVYHFAWDLSFVRLIATDIVEERVWQLFARSIASSFLLLVGVGLVLAHGRGVRWKPFLRRLAVIAAAALVITIATWFAFPDEYIFFGILHCIAAASVLALPFLRAPAVVVVGAALLCFAAPLVLTDPALDAPLLDWLGLGARSPVTNDYVPIFPWFGFVLLGVVAGRLIAPLAARARPRSAIWTTPFARAVIWAGRRSLPIYLLHQPLLLGSLLLIAQITGPNPAAEDAFFERGCEASCAASGVGKAVCGTGCACAAERLKAEGLWRQALADNISPEDQVLVSSVTRQCFRRPGPPE
jgi:uncharacterized membrane protein